MKYNIFFLFLGLLLSKAAVAQTPYPYIKVDQFGYLPNAQKIAVLSNPQQGYNSNFTYTFGDTLALCDANALGAVVFKAAPTPWNGGVTHTQSGDKVAWFDFSAFTTPGLYYIRDLQNGIESYNFQIGNCAYKEPIKQALRALYYQRCGMDKAIPFAEAAWTDTHCHDGNLQDTDCRLHNNPIASTSKDLHGGWHDAGDYNKYVNFTFTTLTELLLAYQENPTVWSDDMEIPESGNQIPDLLDEVKWELDWLLRMQESDGGVLSVVGVKNYATASPPSADVAQRFYGPATTSASFTAASVFALGAIQFQAIGQTTYANTLKTAAIDAWTWANAHPNVTFYNSGTIASGENEVDTYNTFSRQMAAAVFLYKLTNIATYKTYVENNYTNMHLLQWTFAYPFEPTQQDVLLYYASLPTATASVANAIKTAYINSVKTNNADNLPAYLNKTDAYRAYMADNNYTWGNNEFKCHQGTIFSLMNTYNLDAANQTNYKDAAAGFLHYIHGVNPTGYAYMTNMLHHGYATNSISQVYHSWFTDGSALWDQAGISTYGPAPGFISAGANPSYTLDACCANNSCGSAAANALCNAAQVTPPLGQPIQKSYRDFNANWPQNSWTVTEVGIYVQAAYLRLASKYYQSSCISTEIATKKNAQLFELYPNPAKDILTLTMKEEYASDYSYFIQDLAGKTVLSANIHTNEKLTKISVEDLSSGVYILQVRLDNGNFSAMKFLKE